MMSSTMIELPNGIYGGGGGDVLMLDNVFDKCFTM